MRVREPVNAWSHFIGLILATAGTVLLLRLASRPAATVAFAVYGGSLVLLYAASTVYHALPLPPERLRPLLPDVGIEQPGAHDACANRIRILGTAKINAPLTERFAFCLSVKGA